MHNFVCMFLFLHVCLFVSRVVLIAILIIHNLFIRFRFLVCLFVRLLTRR